MAGASGVVLGWAGWSRYLFARTHALDCIVRAEQMNRTSRAAQGDAEFVTVARCTYTANSHIGTSQSRADLTCTCIQSNT